MSWNLGMIMSCSLQIVLSWLQSVTCTPYVNVELLNAEVLCVTTLKPVATQDNSLCYWQNVMPICKWIWKTDQNVTLGLFHFIAPADSYTYMPPVHSGITQLSWLICFSRGSFANHVKSWLRQWACEGYYMEGMGLKLTPVLMRRLLSLPGMSGPIAFPPPYMCHL